MDIHIHAYQVMTTVHWEVRGRAEASAAYEKLLSGWFPSADCPTVADEAVWLCQQIAGLDGIDWL